MRVLIPAAALLLSVTQFGPAVSKPAAAPARQSALQVVSRLESRYADVTDYQCILDSEVHGANRTSRGTYQIWYKKPDLFRLKVVEGRHHGSEITVTPSGRVRARPRGILGKVIVKTMQKSDKRLRSPRGGAPWDANFGALYAELSQLIQAANQVQVKRDSASDMQIILTSAGSTQREVWLVDPLQWVLTGRDIFENGTQVVRARYRDFRPNTGLAEDFFDF